MYFCLKFFREHSLFLLILGVSLALRFIPLFDYQYTLDELSGLNRTRFDTFSGLLEGGVKIDAHPALVQTLIYTLTKLFGYSNWIIKLPFLLFGLGAIVYAYLFARRNYSRRAGEIAATFFSFSLVFVFYAPIARMYISGVFFSVALLYHFYEIVFHRSTSAWQYFFLGLFAWLSAMNQHINALFALSVCASGFLFLKKEQYKAYGITCLLTVLAYLPHLPITLYQLSLGGIGLEQGGWLEQPEWYAILFFLKILLGTGGCFALVLILVLLRLILHPPTGIGTKMLYLPVLFLFNYWVVYQYSIHFSPVYQHSVMLFSGVAFLLFVSGLLDFQNKWLFYSSFSLLSLVLVYTSYVKKDFYRQTLSTVFEYQFQRTAEYEKKYGAKAIYSVFFDADEFMEQIYNARYPVHYEFQMSSDSAAKSLNAFASLLRSLKQDVLVLSSANPLQDALAKVYFPYLIENTVTQANNYRVYSKRESDKGKIVPGEKSLYEAKIHEGLEFSFTYGKEEEAQQHTQVADSGVEFPMEARKTYNSLHLKEGNYLLLHLKGKALALKNKGLELCISITNPEKSETYQYASAALASAHFARDSVFQLTAGTFIGTKHREMLENQAYCNFYLWNRGQERIRVDDFSIQVIEHWPQKWGFWE